MDPNIKQNEELEREIARRFGLRLTGQRRQDIGAALTKLGKRHQLDRRSLGRTLVGDPTLLRELAGLLTIEETYFFRFPEQVAAAVTHLGRRWWQSAPSNLLVWSAGCSTGEEPYSLAIGLHDAFGALTDRCPVVACDINIDALARARAAIYGRWSFRGVSDVLRDRCFAALGNDRFQLLDTYRRCVRFEHLSIQEMARGLADQSVQVVFFRNVGVYLDAPALEACYAGFRRVLTTDGLLIQAATDPIPPRELFERGANVPPGVYQLASNGQAVRPTPTSSLRSRSIPQRPLPAPPPPTALRSPEAPRSLQPPPHVEVLTLADQGHLDQALEVANRMVGGGADESALVLRAQIHLASDRPGPAADDLRRAVFLAPQSWSARYWYIMALHASRQTERVANQIRELRRQLGNRADEDLLDDGITQVGELRRAVATISAFYE